MADENTNTEELTDEDREELGRQVANGNTSGIIDSDGYRISWSIEIEKFEL